MKKTIFLTGSRGFIGSHLLKAIENDYEVICGGRNIFPNYEPDYIIHLAGTTTTSDTFFTDLITNNIVYSSLLMGLTGKAKFIYASSTSASELTNIYAYTKRYVEYLAEQRGNSVGLRFFNVYGPGNNKGIVKRYLDCRNNNQPIELHGQEQIRDFIYIDDVVRTIVDALEWQPGVYDVGTGTGISIFDAYLTMCNIFGPISYKEFEMAKTDMQISIANPGIPNCLTFEEGLKKMLCE